MKTRLFIALAALLTGTQSFTAQLRTPERHSGKMRHYEKTTVIEGIAEDVFAFMDDIDNAGMHMSGRSERMMGGKLALEWLTSQHAGHGTRYRWRGRMLGMKMDFTVEVVRWQRAREKVWGTTGKARMIVIDWFEMYLQLEPGKDSTTTATLGIYYKRSRNLPGLLLGRSYSKWCVKSMLKDTEKHFRGIAAQNKPAKT